MNILRVITSFLLIILPIAILIRDWKFHDKRTKKHHNITKTIIVVWFIGSIVATIFVWVDSTQNPANDYSINCKLIQLKH